MAKHSGSLGGSPHAKTRKSLLFVVVLALFATISDSDDFDGNFISTQSEAEAENLMDEIEDSLFDPIQADYDACNNIDDVKDSSCWELPDSTVEEEEITSTFSIDSASQNFSEQLGSLDIACSFGGDDPDANIGEDEDLQQCTATTTVKFDKHWGSDPNILYMRDRLRSSGSGESIKQHVMKMKQEEEKDEEANKQDDEKQRAENRRPPIFLMPGLASTRLIAWKFKSCPHNPLLSDIKVQDNVWLNLNLILQMSSIDVQCMSECLKLGWNQSDTDDVKTGCKLRPDEGLDAISSLSPGGIGSQLLVGGTNTVYAWLIQWLADNLGYDVSSLIGLPYDWRLSPDKMESRDGFLTLTRRRIEAAVQSNGGEPGIFVAHSMGNLIFRYFLNWLRTQLQKEAYQRFVKKIKKRKERLSSSSPGAFMEDLPSFTDEKGETNFSSEGINYKQLWELAVIEGDTAWYEWIGGHIWTYVGLSAPLLGAVNPLRSVISGERMGLPVSEDVARWIEITFGSTHTVNPVSSKEGFCDEWEVDDWGEEIDKKKQRKHVDARLACLDDILTEIEVFSDHQKRNNLEQNPFENFPALESLLRKRADWNVDFPMMRVETEYCNEKEKSPCKENNITVEFGPKDVHSGKFFTDFSRIWKEEDDPLLIKRDQLRESFWDTGVKNILNATWERPLIKHVIMAYGVDIPTEVGYDYRKTEKNYEGAVNEKVGGKEHDGIPKVSRVIWEREGGEIFEQRIEPSRGYISDLLSKKKDKLAFLKEGTLRHSGDGSVPYLSLAWAHTWLLHATRALRYSKQAQNGGFTTLPDDDEVMNPLDEIEISHRPKGAIEWVAGPPPKRGTGLGEKKIEDSSDTGTAHPHGTKYKPEMIRYHNTGKSRTTGIEYTTSVIEAIGVEHKETTRNYDILAAVFTDVLKFMHEDFKIV